MASSFKPPRLEQLREVDTADCEYTPGFVEVVGVVSPSSQGAWQGAGKYDVHCFSFHAWRRVDGPLINRELTILRPIKPKSNWLVAFPARSIHRIRVLLSKDETRGIFAQALRPGGDDPELVAVVRELEKPFVISTPRFGDLTLNRYVNWFEGDVAWNGQQIRLSLDTDETNEVSAGLQIAEALCDAQLDWKQKVEALAIHELLPLKNDGWLQDGEEPLTAGQFLLRMVLQSISISIGGTVEFWHDDGDMFWGHSILLSGTLTDGITNATIAG